MGEFLMLLVAGGLAPQQVLHVGDDAALDVLGALSAGMQAVWLNRGPRFGGMCRSPMPK